jgi:ribosomal protein L11 methyltransferase
MSRAKKAADNSARFVWRKLSPAKWEDVWQERLGWLGQRLAIIILAGYKTLRLEAHQVTQAEADELKREFGGEIRPARPLTAQELEPAPRPPLRIGGKLHIVGSEKDRAAFAAKNAPVLLIPASLAFGTGDHATTATCLRLLLDATKTLPAGDWEALDLGTGTGILALAARQFGARRVEACDFDPTAVRVSRANAKLNGMKGVMFRRLNVLEWKPDRRWPVVTANVYGPVLIQAAPQIARAVERGGILIISGILREQADDVLAAFRAQGLAIERVVRKGKWVTALARASAATHLRASRRRDPKKSNPAPKTRSSQRMKNVLPSDRAPRSARSA